MAVARDFACNARDFGELHGVAGILLVSKAVPGSQSVELDFPSRSGGLEKLEGGPQALQEFGPGDFAQLRFGIVQIKHIDARYAQILQAALHLIAKKPWGHTVAAADDVFRGKDAWLDVFAEE